MIVVQTTFQLLPDAKKEAIELMRNMVRLCRLEHGCLAYEYFEGVTDPNQVVLLQEWEDADCLQEHYQTEHMEDFLSKLGDFLESPVSTRSYISQESQETQNDNGERRRRQDSKSSQLNDDLPKPEQTIH